MADFCKQCSLEFFGEDTKDCSGLITPEEVTTGLGAVVICEGCGIGIRVDHEGKCLDHTDEQHNMIWHGDLPPKE